MAQEIAKKVTLNKLGIEKDFILEQIRNNPNGPDSPIELAAFVGMISDVKPKKSDLGDYILFEGDFMGTNRITGEVIRSAAMILPSVAETPLVGMFKRAIKTDADGNVLSYGIVEFAITVTAKKDKCAIGYAYGIRSHSNNEGADDPLARMMKLIPPAAAVVPQITAGETSDSVVVIAKADAVEAKAKKR